IVLAVAVLPPMRLLEPLIEIPVWLPGPAAVPEALVPIKLLMMLSPLDWTLIPAPAKLTIFRPLIALPPEPAPRIRLSKDWPPPLICTPGSVVPSIVTGTAIVGRTEIGRIAKVMGSVPEAGGLLLASRMTCRSEPTSEPGTLSVVFVTWNGLAVGWAVTVANTEVLLAGSVAVAVTVWVVCSGVLRLKLAVKACELLVKAAVVTD